MTKDRTLSPRLRQCKPAAASFNIRHAGRGKQIVPAIMPRPEQDRSPRSYKLKRDQKFFDLYSLVIGILAAVALGFFVLAMWVSERTQEAYIRSSDEFLTETTERIKPFGEVYLPGDDLSAAGPQVVEAAAPEPVAATMTGPQVYNEACIACHGSGIGGAPIVDDAAAWEPRIAQGTETLYRHAIEGYTGSAGYMPPKGGRLDLSDEEVQSAVDYMVGQAEGG
jgi:cytochrome c5